MTVPQPERLSCSDNHYTSHKPWFDALKVVLKGFTSKEESEGPRTAFFRESLRSPANPQDLQLALDLILRDSKLNRDDFAELITFWAGSPEHASFDDRTYSSWLDRGVDAKQIENRGVSPAIVLRAWRIYFVNHESADRCAEAGAENSKDVASELRVVFNMQIATLAPDVPTLRAEDIVPASIGDKAIIIDYLRGTNIKKIQPDYSRLAVGTDEQQKGNQANRQPGSLPYLTLEQRSTPEWKQQALAFLDELETWSKDFNQTTREVFFEKSEWYGGFIHLLPEGDLRDQVLRSYVRFLAGAPIERTSPPEWARWVNGLIYSEESRERKTGLDQIEGSGDAAIAAYVELARFRAKSTVAMK